MKNVCGTYVRRMWNVCETYVRCGKDGESSCY